MSELIQQKNERIIAKWQLLAGVSALALIANAATQAKAEDADRPTVWIELGGQLERDRSGQELFAPDFATQFQVDHFLPLEDVERLPRYSNGFEGTLSFQPHAVGWVFSASVRYGRSNAEKSSHNQVATPPAVHILASVPAIGLYFSGTGYPKAVRFADSFARTEETHTTLEFRAGRDVGLGILGGTSKIDLGVRVAQFTTKSSTKITANPGGVVPYKYATQFAGFPANIRFPQLANELWDTYHATAIIARSFKGLGPSVSFDASVPVLGRPSAMQVNVEFGANGAALIGRQKANVYHKSVDDEPVVPHPYNFIPMTNIYHHTYVQSRSRIVVVPNVGGFAGLSFNYSNAKIKLGYRADFFFGAMDGGIDARKTYDRNFYGPFATISIGLGG